MLAACIVIDAATADALKITTEQISALGIEVESITERSAVAKLQFPARVVIPPSQIRFVSAPIAGRVAAVSGGVDMIVKQGQSLAELSGPAWARSQSELVQAIKQQQFLRSTLEREQSLSADRIVSPKQLQATQNDYAQAQATVVEKRNTLLMSGMTDAEIDKLIAKGGSSSPSLTITAPIDAAVLEAAVITGQSVEAMAPMFKLAAMSPLWLEIQVPVARVNKVREQDVVTVPPDLGSGTVVAIGNSVDAISQTVLVRAEITTADRKLRPQQVVEAEITPTPSEAKLWGASPASVVRRDGKAYIFVRTIEGFRAQVITISQETVEATIFSGPFDGTEKIASKGLVPLKGAWQGLGVTEDK